MKKVYIIDLDGKELHVQGHPLSKEEEREWSELYSVRLVSTTETPIKTEYSFRKVIR